MLIRTLVAPLLGTNCHLVVDGGSGVVVDPGRGVAAEVDAALRESGVRLAAVLLTHGHVDHTWDAAELGARHGVPVHVHEADAYRLADPLGSLGPLGAQLAALAGETDGPPVPGDVETFTGGTVAGLETLHAPGHTEGSTVYLVPTDDGPVALTGDVLFAGTIGRCDLPGGDDATMAATLRRLAALDPATRVLPGHGPATSIAAELRTNPYLTR